LNTLRLIISHFSALIKANVLLIVISTFVLPSKAQNYFANADFEALNNCIEYHQDCSSEAWFYIKPAITPLIDNITVPKPFSGKDLLILPVENVFTKIQKRPFVYTMFCCLLTKDRNYKLSFYINTNGKIFHGIDFFMSDKEFTSDGFKADSVKPSIHISSDDIINELNGWNYVETIYTANGTERYCLVGNLSKTAFDFVPMQRMNKAGDVFYFLDDISFTPLKPEKICSNYKENVAKLYAQNLRHTEHALIDTNPGFITDTIIVPAVFFETDKSILKPNFKKSIDKLFVKFKEKSIKKIEVEGHTDNTGTIERNIQLSAERAESIKEYLSIKFPFITNNIIAIGRASNYPIGDNNTALGRAKNRRVQIVITSVGQTSDR
jgi:outer membrane protein OmpA-like peptidoglycan-associated protein